MVTIADSNYDKIREKCLTEGMLWEDPDFPADATSIGPKPIENPVKWMRPHEICANLETKPEFISDEGGRFDILQGGLGDCYMLAALASLTTSPQLFKRMVPEDQTFLKAKKYVGVFRFHFWKYGKWVEILVDDRLPTQHGELLYAQSSDKNEFWGPLLEKAYAKFYGNYQIIEGGWCRDALTDFTGCMSQAMEIEEFPPKKLSKLLFKATERNAILNADVSEPEDAEEMGLGTGHAYSVTGVKKVTLKDGSTVNLIRVRNPWGGPYEWKGRWSDSSKEWNDVPPEKLNEIRMTKKDDGEFWMQLSDFHRYFSHLEICYLDTKDLFDCPDGSGPRCWSISTFYGKWIRNKSAGGKNIHSPSFCKNPQFKVTLNDCDDDDDMASFVVELTQMNRRRGQLSGISIGFYVYNILPGVKLPLSKDYLEDVEHFSGKTGYSSSRSIVKNFTMKPGNYVVIPTAERKNTEGEFMIRVFSEADHQSNEING